jgi:hypothetical protein
MISKTSDLTNSERESAALARPPNWPAHNTRVDVVMGTRSLEAIAGLLGVPQEDR